MRLASTAMVRQSRVRWVASSLPTLALFQVLVLAISCLPLAAGQCAGDQQPRITSVFPPSGSRGTEYTITGQNLNQTSGITIEQDGETISTETLNVTDNQVSFRLTENPADDGLATLTLIPTQAGCVNETVDLFLLRRGVSFPIVGDSDVQPGTVLKTSDGGCLPPECGDNSTEYEIFVLGQQLEKLAADALSFTVRFPDTNTTTEMASLVIQTFYSQLTTDTGIVDYFIPFPIANITPTQGQNGTIVDIRGDNLLGRGNGVIELQRVVVGSSEADILESGQTRIQARVNSGTPGSRNIMINTTQTLDSQSYNGPYTYSNTLWTQLEDGVVSELIPPAAQGGVNISIVGERLLGGGNEITNLTIAGQNVTIFTSVPISDGPSEYIEALIPESADPVSGGVVIVTDTGAVVLSSPNIIFTYTAITSITPSQGQVGTRVVISGTQLLSGYNDLEPVVSLSGIRATVISYDQSTVMVRVEDPSAQTMSGSGADISPNSTGDVTIVVTRDDQSFTVSSPGGWTYLEAGVITEVQPDFGQYGTEVTISGTNLFGYGTELMRALINGTDAMIVSQNDSVVVLMAPDVPTVGRVDIVLVSDTGAEVRREAAFEYRERGVIESANPPSGQNGTYVNITGTNLFGHGDNITMVTFGGVPAGIDYTLSTNTLIRVRIQENPVAVNTPVPIVITATTSAIVESSGNIWTYLVPGRIASVSPNIGQDGTMLEITGTNLLGGGSTVQSILLDGVPATVDVASATSIMATMGSLSEQTDFYRGEVHIVSNTGAVVAGGSYTHRPSGRVTSFSPQSGRAGTRITVEGNNLLGYGDDIDRVLIAGVEGRVVEVVTTSRVIVQAGVGQLGMEGPISLTSNTGAVVSSADIFFVYEEQGSLTTVTPSEGAEGSGILISGTALRPSGTLITNVTIGGSPVSRIVTQSDTEVSVLVGPAPVTNVTNATITITASDGSTISGGSFTFLNLTLSLPLLSRGQQGTLVQILLPNDAAFNPSLPLFATIGGQQAVIIGASVESRYINVTTPRATQVGTYTADVAVQGTSGRVARLRDGFTYLPEGVIFSATPNSGQQGTRVTLIGENLLGGGSSISSVSIGERGGTEVSASVSLATDNTVELRISSNPPTGTNFPLLGDITLVADTGATITRVGGFSLVEPGQVSSVTPSEGQFGTMVTIAGSNLLQDGTRDNISSIMLAGTEVMDILDTPTSNQIRVQANTAAQSDPGQVIITLTTGAQIISPDAVTFQYLQQGAIAAVTPSIGTVGTRVSVTGNNLLGGGALVDVFLGGVRAAVMGTPTDTLIAVTAQERMDESGSGSGSGSGASDMVEIIIDTGAIVQGGSWTYEELGVINNFTPIEGQRGVVVTVTGTSLLGSSASSFTQCRLAGINGTVLSSSDTTATCEAGLNPSAGMNPDFSRLSGPVELTASSGPVITSTEDFEYYVSYISTLEPNNGTNGTYVTITGQNLVRPPGGDSEVDTVSIGGIPVLDETTEISVDIIRVRAGFSNASIDNDVQIVSTSGALVEASDVWVYNEPGQVLSILPTTASPGQTVTINGTDIVPPCVSSVRVIVGQTESYTATVSDTSTVRFRPGPYQAQPGSADNLDTPETPIPIQVIASNGATVYSDTVQFEYATSSARVTAISPTVGMGGVAVTITGQSLLSGGSRAERVTLAGENATIVNSSDTEVVVTAGPGPDEGSFGRVIIESDNGLLAGIGTNVWQYLPLVTSGNVDPLSGQNGTLVSIDLRGILETLTISSVTFNGIPAEVVGTSGNIVSLRAGPSPSATSVGDIVFTFNDGVMLTIEDAWTYLAPVSISALDPPQGYFNTEVRIQGSNFQAGGLMVASVVMAGLDTDIVSQSDTEVTVRVIDFRNSSAGAIVGPVVMYSSFGAVHTSEVMFTYVQLRVDSVSPQAGQGGTVVTLSGVGLLAGPSPATFQTFQLGGVGINRTLVVTDSQIQVVAASSPAQSGLGNITYTVATGGSVVVANSWSYLAPGRVTSVTPTQGTQGTYVTIRGERMLQGGASVASVTISGVAAMEVVVGFDDFIQARAGLSDTALPPGTLSVESDSGAVLVSSMTFEYLEPGRLTSISPTQGQNGTRVTLNGMGFSTGGAVSRVTLAGVEATVERVDGNTIMVEAGRPAIFGPFSGPVVVELSSGMLIYGSNNFTYLSEGVVFTVEPEEGQVGTQVRITGERLFGGGSGLTAVYLAGVEAQINATGSDSTSVSVTALAGSSAPLTGDIVLVSNTGAYVRKIDAWTYVQPGIITDIVPDEGQFGTQITIDGIRLLSGGTSISDVQVGNVSAYQVISSSNTRVVARAGQPGQVDMFSDIVTLVSNFGGTLESNVSWTYRNSSRVISVSPTNGTGNTNVTVTGENLLGGGSSIMSVTTAGVAAISITEFNDTSVVFRVGFNPSGRNMVGDIVLESNTGALTIAVNQWSYEDACPSGQFGTFGNCTDCHEECSDCTGPTDEDCIKCNNFAVPLGDSGMQRCVSQCPNVSMLDNQCVDACALNQYERVNSSQGVSFCYDCHDLCDDRLGCSGPEDTQCGDCEFVYDIITRACARSCPTPTWRNELGQCIPCDSQCVPEAGCTGENNSDCNVCRNVRIAAALFDDGSTPGTITNDICLERCPTGFYVNNASCLPCHQECEGGCTGPSAFECNTCATFSAVVGTPPAVRCVSSCNPDPSMKTMYDDNNSTCQPCSSLCSLEGGCVGPAASDCLGCREDSTSKVPLPLFDGACVLACPNTTTSSSSPPPGRFYYQNNATNACELCHETCTNGCTGSRAEDCITEEDEKTDLFSAGAGAIGVSVGVAVLLAIISLVLLLFLIWCGVKQSRKKYTMAPGPDRHDRMELGEQRYTHRPGETSFSSGAAKKEPVGSINAGFEQQSSDFYYTPMAATASVAPELREKSLQRGQQGPMVVVSERYQKVEPNVTMIANEDAELYIEPGPETAPARPPKPAQPKKEEKGKAVDPKGRPPVIPAPYEGKKERPPPELPPSNVGKTDKLGKRPPPPLPSEPEPELYTDMEASNREIHIQPGPDEEYSEMAQLPAAAAVPTADEFYDDAGSVRPSQTVTSPNDKTPLIEDNMYDDAETAKADYERVKHSMSSSALPPSLPAQPVPKKRYSTPLPATPLEKSLQVESPPIYEATEPVPPEEILYEAIPGGRSDESRVQEAPPSPEGPRGRGRGRKGNYADVSHPRKGMK